MRQTCGKADRFTYISLIAVKEHAASCHLMRAFLFRCPATRLRVQDWVTDDATERDDDAYLSISCQACGQIQLVNLKTGRTVDADPDDA
jgi:hypothetical protein